MQPDTSLADLCAICHVNPIKYTCPRDGVHTCSLPCVKRHKQWAQCSGVRDPAEYRKRSELATAASVDKDFNFITQIERTLSRAEDEITDRGLGLTPARLRPKDARPKLDIELDAQGVKIIRAPKGLSRNKQNRTYWGGGQPKCVVWTTEWLLEDGRRLFSAANETRPVQELFGLVHGGRRNSKKRKRVSDLVASAQHINEADNPQPQQQSEHSTATKPQESHLAYPDTTDHQPNPATRSETSPAATAVPTDKITTITNHPPQPNSTSNQYFYLHRPQTDSRFKCLIPLSPTASLQESLNHRTLLEFPTIYVRSEPPDQLQPPFITEDEYTQRHGVDIPINVTVPIDVAVDEEDLEEGEVALSADIASKITESKILEVLAEDLGG